MATGKINLSGNATIISSLLLNFCGSIAYFEIYASDYLNNTAIFAFNILNNTAIFAFNILNKSIIFAFKYFI